MAKQFLANRSGQTPTLDEVPNEVIKIYDDKAAAQADLSNIEENEIIATKAGESEGVVEVVDTVEENNPNAVSSGAVYDYANALLNTELNDEDWVDISSQITPQNGYNFDIAKAIRKNNIVTLRVAMQKQYSGSSSGTTVICSGIPEKYRPNTETAVVATLAYRNASTPSFAVVRLGISEAGNLNDLEHCIISGSGNTFTIQACWSYQV